MVSARGDGAVALVRRGSVATHMRLTAYERARKPHQLRTGIDARTNCMHRFCADCILPKIHTGAKKCPLCKRILPKKTPLKSDANFDAVISKFAMTPERRCLKRSISESNSLCFAKRRLVSLDKKTPTKRQSQVDVKSVQSSPQRMTPSKIRPQLPVKPETVVEVASSCFELKPSVVTDSRSETSEPSLVIDEGSTSDDVISLSQPTSSTATISRSGVDVFDDQTKNVADTHESSVTFFQITLAYMFPNKAFVVQRGPVVNFPGQSGASLVVLGTGINIDEETSKRLVASGHCDAPPIIVLQNSPPSSRLNGFDGAKLNASGLPRSASRIGMTGSDRCTKYIPIQPHPGALNQPAALASSSSGPSLVRPLSSRILVSSAQSQRGSAVQGNMSKAPTPTTSQASHHLSSASAALKASTTSTSSAVNGVVLPAFRSAAENNPEDGGICLAKSLSRSADDNQQLASPCGASIASPPDYLFLPPKQRMLIGIEAELILYPEASVTLDKKLPDAAKRPRFVVTYPGATGKYLLLLLFSVFSFSVGHLCEYIMQRIAVESGSTRLKKRRVSMCAVKMDLGIEDVLVVSETGEGQFATLNVRGEKCDSQSSSVFTIGSPFNVDLLLVARIIGGSVSALDDLLTVEKLRSDYWANKKRPLRLIFKFVPLPPSGK
ncbi:unnamed protein product [Toxocara canis]|uniref:RING-type E3 ubiquitin transferase n=1 Tax=Toxocara canis TaxID=6265 RepID=A0A183UTF5_TOXCA|nr:unnamed protein product [Toxocara canis]